EGVALDLATRHAAALDGGAPDGVRVVARRGGPLPLWAWVADELRAGIGSDPVLWLEGRFFGARDTLARARSSWFGAGGSEVRAAGAARVPAALEDTWPPPPVTP